MAQPYSFSRQSRDVPLSVRLQVLLGGSGNQIGGWIFIGLGMLFVWIFLPHADLTSFYVFRSPLDQTQGTITDSQPSGFSEGGSKQHSGTPIYRYDYTFTVDGTRYDGVSYSPKRNSRPVADVTIEYPSGNPLVSRIHGMRRAPLSPVVLIVIIFPLIGAGIVISGLRQGRKANRLLANGKIAFGTFKSMERTKGYGKRSRVYKLIFDFTTETGETHQAVASTYRPERLAGDQPRQIVYDPDAPSSAVVVDNLPGAPRIDDRGVIQPAGFGSVLLVTILPALVIITNIACLCVKLMR